MTNSERIAELERDNRELRKLLRGAETRLMDMVGNADKRAAKMAMEFLDGVDMRQFRRPPICGNVYDAS